MARFSDSAMSPMDEVHAVCCGPLVTGKAFPEDEAVITAQINIRGVQRDGAPDRHPRT